MAISVDLLQDSIFLQLETTTLKQVAEVALTRRFIPRDLFYKQGDASVGLFLIKEGQIKLYRQSQDKIQILALLSEQDIFGVDSSCNQSACPTFAEAISVGWVVFLPCAEIEHLMKTYPDFSLLLLHIVSQELQQFTSLVHSLAFRDVSTRLAEVILKQITIQQKTPQQNQVTLERKLSQHDLAALVGTAREVIYRTLKKFEQDNLLQLTPTHILILDFDRLTNLAQKEID